MRDELESGGGELDDVVHAVFGLVEPALVLPRLERRDVPVAVLAAGVDLLPEQHHVACRVGVVFLVQSKPGGLVGLASVAKLERIDDRLGAGSSLPHTGAGVQLGWHQLERGRVGEAMGTNRAGPTVGRAELAQQVGHGRLCPEIKRGSGRRAGGRHRRWGVAGLAPTAVGHRGRARESEDAKIAQHRR
ncbi:MAG: hypothetical protein B7733_10255 [Myxococcales bacterium FL481]|nr:MAG: hypothetical protein B7733_10255 [Myxococcales bacterium FL481]